MNTIIIRAYKDEDFDTFCELLKLNIPTYFAAEEYQDFENYLKDEIENYFVAEVDHQVVGCGGVNIKKDEHVAMISWDIIHPAFQGKGIGKRILQHRIEFIQRHYPTYKIMVRTSHLVYRFYEKQGFQLLEIQKDYWADGFDMYKMEYQPA